MNDLVFVLDFSPPPETPIALLFCVVSASELISNKFIKKIK